ncbi:hypothetical protein WR25_10275 [Diploscapter pachys]|uniref:Major facilitator superfamily (MFS) profile domain-containing protein n=1 Tax=Diploscapter pachys TaxID=2018661 RepID=A0A2A2JTI3_9BILA|nr:hypothetical protein WR25_10275 [Diploscapter pachys]
MPGTSRLDEETLKLNQTMYDTGFTRSDKTLIYSSVAVGSLFAVLPISFLISKIGCRKVFFTCGLLSSVATCLIPFVAAENLTLFLVLRFLQGVAFASGMPTAGSVTSSWSPILQHGLFISTLTVFPVVGCIIAMPISGVLCTSSLGWKAVYFILSAFSFVMFTIWGILYTNDPEEHSLVSKSELRLISSGKSSEGTNCDKLMEEESESIPYRKILLTPSIAGVCAGALVHVFSPIYIKNILGYSVHETGFASAIPVMLQFVVKIFSGLSSDMISCLSETAKLRLFNTIAMWLSGAFLLSLAFVDRGEGFYGMLLMTSALMLQGFNGPGFNKVRSSLKCSQSCSILVCYPCFTTIFTFRACHFAIFMVPFDAGFTDFGKSYLLEKV